jgi:hypothetical protein
MKYFKKSEGSIWVFEDEGQDELITDDMLLIDKAEAEALMAVAAAAPPPPVILQIRALEQQYTDDQARLMRQVCIETTLVQACTRPEANGLTRAQVHNTLMSQGKGYAQLVNLEAQVALLRAKL